MKKLFSACAVVFACAALFSGCTKTEPPETEYEIYTNLPAGSYELLLDNFKVAGTVAGEASVTDGSGAAESPDAYKSMGKTFYYIMTADATIVIADDFTDAASAEARCEQFINSVGDKLAEINSSLSIGEEHSAVSLFNSAAAGDVIEVDKTAYDVFTLAEQMYGFTDGYYNPAVYYSVEAYGFNTNGSVPETAADLPSDAAIEKFRQLSSHFGDIQIFEEEGKFYVKKPAATVEIDGVTYSMKIDLGGIGKGYTVDVVNAMLDESGFKYGYFDFGSSSIVCKSHFKFGAYELEFRNPRAEFFGQQFLKTKIKNECISTSADDVKYYVLDGVRYCHVIDPTTGKPVNKGIMSATVIGGTAAEGDALTTALMAMGKDKALTFIENKLKDRKVVFTYDNN